MRAHLTACLLLVAAVVVGCSREDAVRCESDLRYSAARSAPPVQIPDDLSPPNESDALRLPADATVATTTAASGGCLESPPSFFRDEMPFRRRSDEPPPAPAAEPSAPAPASESPAGDRSIDN